MSELIQYADTLFWFIGLVFCLGSGLGCITWIIMSAINYVVHEWGIIYLAFQFARHRREFMEWRKIKGLEEEE